MRRGLRANGTNPRALGTNPRALGINPRAYYSPLGASRELSEAEVRRLRLTNPPVPADQDPGMREFVPHPKSAVQLWAEQTHARLDAECAMRIAREA